MTLYYGLDIIVRDTAKQDKAPYHVTIDHYPKPKQSNPFQDEEVALVDQKNGTAYMAEIYQVIPSRNWRMNPRIYATVDVSSDEESRDVLRILHQYM